MIKFRNLEIKKKLTSIIMLTSTVALLLACIALVTIEMISYKNGTIRQLSVLTKIVADNSTAALTFNYPENAEEILSALRVEKYIVSAYIYDRQKELFAKYQRGDKGSILPEEVDGFGHFFKNDYLFIVQPVILDQEIIGKVILQYDISEIFIKLKQYGTIIFSVFLVSILVAFVVSSKLQKLISQPILHLLNTAKKVSVDKDYSIRAEKESEDELGLLIDAFNQMLTQIQERDSALKKEQEKLEKRVEERTQELRQEVNERKKIETQIRESLVEKEVLLKEIHHRVKNNLQVVSSLLYLQARNIRDKKTHEMLKESQNRVRTMALIHEELYKSKDIIRIDFAEYIQSITSHLFHSYGVSSDKVNIAMEIDDIPLSIDKAIPCGLIVNEVVSNSFKYAFPNGKGGDIFIRLKENEDNFVQLIIGDNGVGLPKGFDFRKTKTLGLQLVHALTKQLSGNIDLYSNGGTEFKIEFTL